jgi:hypothetical protein
MKLSEKELHRILEHGRHFPFLSPKERDEGGNGHWRTRMWETSAIEIWGTTRDLGFPVSKDKDLVRSARDAVEDRRINLVISPEILSFCRRKSKNGTMRKNQTCAHGQYKNWSTNGHLDATWETSPRQKTRSMDISCPENWDGVR